MSIEVRREGPVDMVRVTGDLVAGPSIEALRDCVAASLGEPEPLVVLDLGRVTRLDSAALGELVACREHVRRLGGLLKLVLPDGGRALLSTSGLDRLFEVFRDADDALESFTPDGITFGIP
jgi:anti-anti-sigma factor